MRRVVALLITAVTMALAGLTLLGSPADARELPCLRCVPVTTCTSTTLAPTTTSTAPAPSTSIVVPDINVNVTPGVTVEGQTERLVPVPVPGENTETVRVVERAPRTQRVPAPVAVKATPTFTG